MSRPRATTSPPGDSAREDDAALFAQLVHDLRNPLGVISYFAEALPEAAEIERPELCERLQLNTRRAMQVVEEFALLADLRHGRAVADDATWDGAALLTELVAEIEALERRPDCVDLNVSPGAEVRGDRAQLACAVRGLLRETVRGGSGPVVVRLTDEDGCTVVSLAVPLRNDPELEIVSCLDEGALPLELARGVAELHGGTFTMEQRPGRAALAIALPR
ncbi:MAG: histidine kinase dimerization/phospho-acceptor domain-containing protein [Deltaproteobacteria bacterium]|nr:histidine kinase dimerization/phospho-acceptor domain-containing protein [Deltaproteobacteria bacterium]